MIYADTEKILYCNKRQLIVTVPPWSIDSRPRSHQRLCLRISKGLACLLVTSFKQALEFQASTSRSHDKNTCASQDCNDRLISVFAILHVFELPAICVAILQNINLN